MPTISALSPAHASPVQKTDLVITGTNFGTDKSLVKVYLSNSTHPKAYELSIYQFSDTSITAILGGGESGDFSVSVVLAGKGKAIPTTSTTNNFSYKI